MSTYTSLPALARGASLAVATAAASLIALAVAVPAAATVAPPAALLAIGTMTLGPAAALWRVAGDLDEPADIVATPPDTGLTFEAPVTDAEIDDLRRLLLGNAVAPSITSVARAMRISTGEASKRVARAEAAGLVTKRREGKRVTVTLVA